jgi:hypothetical protein
MIKSAKIENISKNKMFPKILLILSLFYLVNCYYDFSLENYKFSKCIDKYEKVIDDDISFNIQIQSSLEVTLKNHLHELYYFHTNHTKFEIEKYNEILDDLNNLIEKFEKQNKLLIHNRFNLHSSNF